MFWLGALGELCCSFDMIKRHPTELRLRKWIFYHSVCRYCSHCESCGDDRSRNLAASTRKQISKLKFTIPKGGEKLTLGLVLDRFSVTYRTGPSLTIRGSYGKMKSEGPTTLAKLFKITEYDGSLNPTNSMLRFL